MTDWSEEKTCTKCGEVRPPSSFGRSRDRIPARCKPCLASEKREWHRRLRERDPEEWHRREKIRQERHQEGRKRISRRAQLRQYGLTIEDFEALLATQGGVCAICLHPPAEGFGPSNTVLHVDHCHQTGRVRGLLCFRCNHLLGKAQDDPSRLRRAAEYLEVA